MYTRCRTPARDAACTRLRALSSSPFGPPAQCTTVSTPATAASTPSPVARSPVTNPLPAPESRARRLSTRTGRPASVRSGATRRPSVPVAPVSRMSDVMPTGRAIRRECDGYAARMVRLPDAVDAVADETGFSGVVAVDRGGEFEFAEAYGYAHR